MTLDLIIALPLLTLGFLGTVGFFLRSKKLEAALHESQLKLARAETYMAQAEKAHGERLRLLENAESRLKETFQSLSGEALQKNADQFMRMAQGVLREQTQRAEGDLELRRQAVDQMVLPLNLTLEKVESRIGELEKQRVGAYEALRQQVSSLLEVQNKLQLEAAHLATALKSPTTRGRWGELQLRRVVELAGMLAYCDFFEQHSSTNSDGKSMRPDMVVRLPGNRTIAIDSKAPLQAYMEALEIDDGERRALKFQEHAGLLRRQIQALSQKSYWESLEGSNDFVLLFLPGEAFYSSALQADPSLLEFGAENRVLIATPTTLIALLRTTAHAWRQEDISKNAEEISKLGRELHGRLVDLAGHAFEMGRDLAASVKTYNKFVGTLETRVLVSARRFQDLRAEDPKKLMKEMNIIDEVPRGLSSKELLDVVIE